VSGTVTGQPYNCTSGGVSLFSDVSPTDIFCKGVHYIAAQNVTSGCAPALFCPFQKTTRAEMAIFIAKGTVAPAGGSGVPLTYGPDPVTGFSYSCDPASPSLHFTDISVSDSFCKHAHFLWAKGIIVGCSATQYCPTVNVGRDEMSKFLTNAFRLLLYGP
jgi:S-layer homology domain